MPKTGATMSNLDQPKTELPQEARRWNWGAFLLTWIWGLGNRTPIALLGLIPLVNIVMMFVLGAKGNAWAWQNDTWKGVDHFKRTQRHWAIAGVIVWLGLIVIVGGTFWGIQSLIKGAGGYQLTMETLRASPEVKEVFGEPLEEGFMPMGSVETSGGQGRSDLQISISGPKAAGWAYSRAIKEFGTWRITSLVVVVDGTNQKIVLVEP